MRVPFFSSAAPRSGGATRCIWRSAGRRTRGAAPPRLTADSSEVLLPLPPGPAIEISVEYRITIDTTRRRQLGYDLYGSTESADSWYPTFLQLPDSVRRFSSFDVDVEAPADVAVLTSGSAADSTGGAVTRRRRSEEHTSELQSRP